MKNIFNQSAHNEIVERINRLSPNSSAQWGKMSVSQMLHHCQKPFEIFTDDNDFGLKPMKIIQWFFKKTLYNDKPWRKGLPTAPDFVVKDDRDFEKEKEILLERIEAFRALQGSRKVYDHPAFGKFTEEQIGQMSYKHLDHHLTQFGE